MTGAGDNIDPTAPPRPVVAPSLDVSVDYHEGRTDSVSCVTVRVPVDKEGYLGPEYVGNVVHEVLSVIDLAGEREPTAAARLP